MNVNEDHKYALPRTAYSPISIIILDIHKS